MFSTLPEQQAVCIQDGAPFSLNAVALLGHRPLEVQANCTSTNINNIPLPTQSHVVQQALFQDLCGVLLRQTMCITNVCSSTQPTPNTMRPPSTICMRLRASAELLSCGINLSLSSFVR